MDNKYDMVIKHLYDLSEREKDAVDEFITKKTTNGEFINTLKFLEYHPEGRFKDDSIIVFDSGSGVVRGVVMAAQNKEDKTHIISHPGTTFAGPVIDRNIHIKMAEEILNLIFDYYERRYNKIQFKLQPSYYSLQPFNIVDYFLLCRGYKYNMTGLANIINILDIETEDDILKLFKQKRRNHVKKALKENLLEFNIEKEIKSEVWKSLEHNLKIKYNTTATHTLQEIQILDSKFKQEIQAAYVYTKDGLYGAFALCFYFKNIIHTQYLDSNYLISGNYPNLFLIFNLIKEARKLGFNYFSFGASTEDAGKILNYGLYNYKAGYGGGDIILPVYTKIIK